MAAPTAVYFAYIDPSEETFSASEHAVFDETVFDFHFEHVEGDFPLLTCTIKNPGQSLLHPSRQQWIWFALHFEAFGIVPIFRGRVVAVPDGIFLKENQYLFRGRPQDWQTQREALADAVRAEGAESFDPVFVRPERRENPDNIFDALAKRWHIHPTTHVVTLSNYNIGEDGTITLDESDLFEGSVNLRVGGRALRQVKVTADVQWPQRAAGSVDLWPSVLDAAGSSNPQLATYTGEGLQRTWFQEGASIGGDWSHGTSSLTRVDGVVVSESIFEFTLDFNIQSYVGSTFISPTAEFPLWRFLGEWEVDFKTERTFTERLVFRLKADTQLVFDEDEDADDAFEELNYSSGQVGEPVDDATSDDPDGAFPIGDFRNRRYFSSARGLQSIRYLLKCARANILESARNVEVDAHCDIELAATQFSLRKNAGFVASEVLAPVGGVATGKIIAYFLEGNFDAGTWDAGLTIGCTTGRGNAVVATSGTEDWSEDYSEDWTDVIGLVLLAGDDDVTFEPPSYEPDDDGVDFTKMTPSRILQASTDLPGGLVVNGKQSVQEQVLSQSFASLQEAADALNENYTEVCFQLVPLNTGPFTTRIPQLTVSKLMVPRTIDLEAGSA